MNRRTFLEGLLTAPILLTPFVFDGCSKKEPPVKPINTTSKPNSPTLEIILSIEGKANSTDYRIEDDDVINIGFRLKNAVKSAGKQLTLKYFMVNERLKQAVYNHDWKQIMRNNDLILIGERSDFSVERNGTADLEGFFQFDNQLESAYEKDTAFINPGFGKNYRNNGFLYLVQVFDDKGKYVTGKIWGNGSNDILKFQTTIEQIAAQERVVQARPKQTKIELKQPQLQEPAIARDNTDNQATKKKVFIYEQQLNRQEEAFSFAVVDFYQPHLYEIERNRNNNVRIKDKASKSYEERLHREAKRNDFKITPMLSVFDKDLINYVLDNKDYYANAIAALVKKHEWNGIVIDFETIRLGAERSKSLTQFMATLRQYLPSGNYTLSMATSPRFKENNGRDSASNGYKHHGFYDFRELGQIVDYLQVMAYDFHNKSKYDGKPILPEDKIKPIVDYAFNTIQHDKVVFLMPMYGYVWDGNGRGISGMKASSVQQYIDTAKNNNGTITYKNGELYIRTNDPQFDRIVSTQDEKVFKRRHDLLDQLGVSNFGYWRGSHASRAMFQEIARWKKE